MIQPLLFESEDPGEMRKLLGEPTKNYRINYEKLCYLNYEKLCYLLRELKTY